MPDQTFQGNLPVESLFSLEKDTIFYSLPPKSLQNGIESDNLSSIPVPTINKNNLDMKNNEANAKPKHNFGGSTSDVWKGYGNDSGEMFERLAMESPLPLVSFRFILF